MDGRHHNHHLLVTWLPFAWLIAKAKTRWQPLLMMLLILPFWTNSLVRTYALKLLFANNGLINKSLLAIGLIDAPIDILYTQVAVIAGLTYLLFPFMVLPLYAVFTDLRNDMLLASQDLGASKTQTFWHIILPLTTPGIISGYYWCCCLRWVCFMWQIFWVVHAIYWSAISSKTNSWMRVTGHLAQLPACY